tara:strand:- start:87 stop:263 length:177 start_codon:yes stop_codon:yes gene_type:complete
MKPTEIVRAVLTTYGIIVDELKGCWIGHRYAVAVADGRYIKISLDTLTIIQNKGLEKK